MGATGPREDADGMLTPIVTEVFRAFEPVVRDTFIREFEQGQPRERAAASNVVSLASHRARRPSPVGAPLRAA